jgi:predicted glutamine amidotransferase
MCRALAYLGQPVLLDDLLYKPDSSLIRQAYLPQMLSTLSLGGFGMLAWDPASFDPGTPFTYKSVALPIFDANLRGMAQKIRASCLLAHVRGVPHHGRVTLSEHNLHPFRFDGVKLALAHNGDLAHFAQMRYALVEHIRPELAVHIHGNTDTEWIYALFLSQLDDPGRINDYDAVMRAMGETLRILRLARERSGIRISSAVNLFIGDGTQLFAVRFTFDFGCYPTDDLARVHESNLAFLSLWYTSGREYGFYDDEWKMIGGSASADSVLVASEPLTRDVSAWREVPEYSMLYVRREDGVPRIGVVELDA